MTVLGCSAILDDVLQTGSIDIHKLMTRLIKDSESNFGYFFQVENDDQFICRFSSDTDSYLIGGTYSIAQVPSNQFSIYVRDFIVAVICLENHYEESLANVHDCIATALHFTKMQQTHHRFLVTISNKVITNLNDIYTNVVSLKPTNIAKNTLVDMIRTIGKSTSFLDDIRDYSLLTSGRFIADQREHTLGPVIKRSVANSGRTHINTHITKNVPTKAILDAKKFEKLMYKILSNFAVDETLELIIDSEEISPADGFLFCDLHTQLPSELTTILSMRYLNPDHLDWYVAKRLAEFYGGFIKVINEKHLLFSIRFKYSGQDNVLKDRKILLLLTSKMQRDKAYRSLTTLDAAVVLFNESDASLQLSNIASYDVAVMDDTYAPKYLQRFRDNHVPVIGVSSNTNFQYDGTIGTVLERNIIDAYKKILQEKE